MSAASERGMSGVKLGAEDSGKHALISHRTKMQIESNEDARARKKTTRQRARETAEKKTSGQLPAGRFNDDKSDY